MLPVEMESGLLSEITSEEEEERSRAHIEPQYATEPQLTTSATVMTVDILSLSSHR
jgi:hypothetical protein